MQRACIDIGNIEAGLLPSNLVRSPQDFQKFEDQRNGVPILIPADPKLLDYDERDIFEIEAETLLDTIFATQNSSYVGYQTSFQTNRFLAEFEVKQSARAEIDFVASQNREVCDFVGDLRSKFSTVGGFQTRNIPHFGHEKIIETMLDHCDHVVINPVVGTKKRGDVKLENLESVFDEIISKKFFGRTSFKPIYANMFYAGPREAVHHALIRRHIGFTHFSVGRDHAGAENIYPEEAAPNLLRTIQNEIGIKILTHDGAYFCNQCNKVVLKNTCGHSENCLQSISGSAFRTCIKQKTLYELADAHVQQYLFTISAGLFEE